MHTWKFLIFSSIQLFNKIRVLPFLLCIKTTRDQLQRANIQIHSSLTLTHQTELKKQTSTAPSILLFTGCFLSFFHHIDMYRYHIRFSFFTIHKIYINDPFTLENLLYIFLSIRCRIFCFFFLPHFFLTFFWHHCSHRKCIIWLTQ